MPVIIAFFVGIFLLWIICKILSVPLKIIWKLLLNALIGAVVLILFNFLGGIVGAVIPITFWTALITGLLGVAGIVILIIARYVLFLF